MMLLKIQSIIMIIIGGLFTSGLLGLGPPGTPGWVTYIMGSIWIVGGLIVGALETK